jgi:hypothetical protein
MTEQQTIIEQKTQQRVSVLQEKPVQIGKKTIRIPFQISMPNTSSDFKVICDVLEPSFISQEMKEYEGKDFISAIAYKINEFHKIRRDYIKHFNQTSLLTQRLGYQMLTYLDKIKLILIEPNTEFLRIGDRKRFSNFLKLDPPDYLKEYFLKRKAINDKTGKEFENLHTKFWESLFIGSKIRGKEDITHFISWDREKTVNGMGSDKFIPPVPYIKNTNSKNEFIKFTKDINDTAYELYGDESAFYVIFDMDLFRDLSAIEQIAGIIDEAKNNFIIIKILGIRRINDVGFGDYAKRNLEYFLKVLSFLKSIKPEKIIGLLDGGGFGYCLMGIIDFFTDTVSNYPQDSFKRYKEDRYRGLIHPRTFTVEPIEGVVQHQREYGSLFHDNSIADSYRGKDIFKTSREIWSLDARKMGLLFWQKRMWSLLNTNKIRWDKMRFDEILNSDFSSLGVIVRRIMNGQ